MKVFLTDISDISDDLIKQYQGMLSDTEKERYKNIKDKNRQLQFLIGRALIYDLFHVSPILQEDGKPTIPNSYISLAHSGKYVILTVSDNPVGVDIEDWSEKRDFLSIAKRMKFSLSDNIPLSFYCQFTQYEADYKLGKIDDEIQHSFYSFNTFIICISYMNKNEKIDFYNSIPLCGNTSFILDKVQGMLNENL